ncbi:hypothetical protein [Asticcacaulis sp. YBE204]|uniref:hypothetical protein n=1 Tax=Asticcacaulis sp. YBE204 TaxID=1282363 RepID=UPI0003C3ED03|nr:hypothetical protein [Asticcacaulis sp. YBE204]ESQ79840.1 hypothetical protein AEYBE204_08320 [Asticcacaulis sp. YBE204]
MIRQSLITAAVLAGGILLSHSAIAQQKTQPGVKAAAMTPPNGKYQCYSGAGGNMKLNFAAGNSYSNEQGKAGKYTVSKDGLMTFTNGPWAGFYAKVIGPTKVGLTSNPAANFYQMTCDLKK